jgi:hypothetical protein
MKIKQKKRKEKELFGGTGNYTTVSQNYLFAVRIPH